MGNVAVIDLGTNTFHILIVCFKDQSNFDVIYRERCYVYLGRQGLDLIGKESYDKGVETLQYFATLLEKYKVTQVKAIGTAALRTASNGLSFAREVLTLTGIEITIISGDQEALYIAQGISKIYTKNRPHLVMDIGGGSVEFIIGSDTIDWHASFDVGISILYQKFMRNDPISLSSLDEMNNFLDTQLLPLKEALDRYGSYDLIGAAGTFEVLASHQNGDDKSKLQQLNIDKIKELYQMVVKLNLNERMAIDGIPDHRAKYLVVAIALIMKAIEMVNLDTVYVSSYSMKEGVLLDFLDSSKI